MKEIIILGAIGKNPRKNRDGFRVFDKGGILVTLQSHISVEPPLTVKKINRVGNASSQGSQGGNVTTGMG